MLCSKLIKPTQEGRVILFIKGKLVNKGKKTAVTFTPQFFSPKHKAYECEMLFFLGRPSQHLGFILSPDEFYEFASYFILPVRAVIGGKILFQSQNPFSFKPATIELNFDRSTAIHDSLTQKGLTNTPFASGDDDDLDED